MLEEAISLQVNYEELKTIEEGENYVSGKPKFFQRKEYQKYI